MFRHSSLLRRHDGRNSCLEALKQFPLSQRGRRRTRPGVVSSLGLPALRETPALSLLPLFSNEEFLATARSGHFPLTSDKRIHSHSKAHGRKPRVRAAG